MADRISTFSTHNNTVTDILQAQSDLARLSRQISSGREANTFKELGSDTTRVLDLESVVSASNSFIRSNDIIISRLQVMDLAVQQLEDVAAEAAQQIVIERSSSGANFDLGGFARSALQQIEQSLNTKQGGRSLFAGSKTNLDPVQNLELNSNIINGEVNDSYYQGDNLLFSVQASEQLQLEYGVKANEPAFQKLIGGLHLAIAAEQSGVDLDMQRAAELIEESVRELTEVRSRVNSDIITLRSANDRHEKLKLQLNETLNDITGVDVVEASIQVALNEAVLTATLQTFTRISNLSLSNFIN